MPILDELKGFNLAAATQSLWVYKKSGAAGEPPVYTGRWVDTTPALNEALRATVSAAIDSVEETLEYGLLAQNNEASVLTLDAIETHAGLIIEGSTAELDELKVTQVRHIQNAKFLAIRLVHNDRNLYAVSRTDGSWQTKARKSYIPAVFSDEQLTLNDEPSFEIPKHVDFFIFEGMVLIQDKNQFESILNYREAHQTDFVALQQEDEFLAIFSDIAPIVAHVGSNKIQLRRACAIRTKGHYKSPDFMGRLRVHHAEYGLTLHFDEQGRIMPTPETCRDVFIALLDHRLASAFSTQVYDVPNTVLVQIAG